jgi:hypothetical protein
MSREAVDATVLVSVFNMARILWLQLESLCRQETTFSWELLVGEEPSDDYAGPGCLEPYRERLWAAGCKSTTYVAVPKWIPVSQKIHRLANLSRGKYCLPHAADDYASPDRIQRACTVLQGGVDWYDVEQGLFLNLLDGSTGTYVSAPDRTGLCLSTLISHLRNLSGPYPTLSVDLWLRSQIKPEKICRELCALRGLQTDGVNIIGPARADLYRGGEFRALFSEPSQQVQDILPEEVLLRLASQFPGAKLGSPTDLIPQ